MDTLEEVQEEKLEENLWREVRRLLEAFLEEQTRQKKEDYFLVERVQDLEEKLKAVTEDGNIKYTIEELSAFSGYGYRRNGSDTEAYRRRGRKARAFPII